jgi:hypothetical protein
MSNTVGTVWTGNGGAGGTPGYVESYNNVGGGMGGYSDDALTESGNAFGGVAGSPATHGLFGIGGSPGSPAQIGIDQVNQYAGQAQGAINQEEGTLGLAQQMAEGKGPSAATAMLKQQSAQTQAATNAMASSGTGQAGQGAARRQAMMQGATAQQTLAGQAATARAQEQIGAIGQSANIEGNIEGQNQALGTMYGNLSTGQANIDSGHAADAQQASQAANQSAMQGISSGAGAVAGLMLAAADGDMGGDGVPVGQKDFVEPNRPAQDAAHWTIREEKNFLLAKNQRTGQMYKLATVPLSPQEHRQALAPHGAGPLGANDPRRQRSQMADGDVGGQRHQPGVTDDARFADMVRRAHSGLYRAAMTSGRQQYADADVKSGGNGDAIPNSIVESVYNGRDSGGNQYAVPGYQPPTVSPSRYNNDEAGDQLSEGALQSQLDKLRYDRPIDKDQSDAMTAEANGGPAAPKTGPAAAPPEDSSRSWSRVVGSALAGFANPKGVSQLAKSKKPASQSVPQASTGAKSTLGASMQPTPVAYPQDYAEAFPERQTVSDGELGTAPAAQPKSTALSRTMVKKPPEDDRMVTGAKAAFERAFSKLDAARKPARDAREAGRAQEAAYRTSLQDPSSLLKRKGSHAQALDTPVTAVGNQGTFMKDEQGNGYYVPKGGGRALETLTSPSGKASGVYDYDPGQGPGGYGPNQDPSTGNYRVSPSEEYENVRRSRRLQDPKPQQAEEETVSAEPEPAWGKPAPDEQTVAQYYDGDLEENKGRRAPVDIDAYIPDVDDPQGWERSEDVDKSFDDDIKRERDLLESQRAPVDLDSYVPNVDDRYGWEVANTEDAPADDIGAFAKWREATKGDDDRKVKKMAADIDRMNPYRDTPRQPALAVLFPAPSNRGGPQVGPIDWLTALHEANQRYNRQPLGSMEREFERDQADADRHDRMLAKQRGFEGLVPGEAETISVVEARKRSDMRKKVHDLLEQWTAERKASSKYADGDMEEPGTPDRQKGGALASTMSRKGKRRAA